MPIEEAIKTALEVARIRIYIGKHSIDDEVGNASLRPCVMTNSIFDYYNIAQPGNRGNFPDSLFFQKVKR